MENQFEKKEFGSGMRQGGEGFKVEKKPEIKKEHQEEERVASEGLRREIELMELDEKLKDEAEQKAKKIQFLADDDKLKNLLELAKTKGILFAIKTAQTINDPYLLDTFHDILAKEGYYKTFEK